MSLGPETKRRLRASALRLAEARQARAEAIAVAYRAGADITDISQELGMDAFDVRDVLERAGALRRLATKEAAARGTTPGGTAAPRRG